MSGAATFDVRRVGFREGTDGELKSLITLTFDPEWTVTSVNAADRALIGFTHGDD